MRLDTVASPSSLGVLFALQETFWNVKWKFTFEEIHWEIHFIKLWFKAAQSANCFIFLCFWSYRCLPSRVRSPKRQLLPLPVQQTRRTYLSLDKLEKGGPKLKWENSVVPRILQQNSAKSRTPDKIPNPKVNSEFLFLENKKFSHLCLNLAASWKKSRKNIFFPKY